MIQRLIDLAIVELGVHRASEAPECDAKNSDSQLLKCGERPALLPTVIHHESRAPRERDHANPDHPSQSSRFGTRTFDSPRSNAVGEPGIVP